MHEFSVATDAVDKIMKNALARGAKRIREVEVIIGELSLVGREQFLFWMKEMLNSKGEIASDVKIDSKLLKAVIKCRHCEYEGNLKAKDEEHLYPLFCCPSCNQTDVQIKQGRTCVLNRIQIET